MALKRKYIAPLALLILLPIYGIVSRNADRASNLESAKHKIADWIEVKTRFPGVSIKRIPHPDVGTMLSASGSVNATDELIALHEWFESFPNSYSDEIDYSDVQIPTTAQIVRYEVSVPDLGIGAAEQSNKDP